MWSKLRNLEYRDLFWLLLGSVMGQHSGPSHQPLCNVHHSGELMPTTERPVHHRRRTHRDHCGLRYLGVSGLMDRSDRSNNAGQP